MTPRPSHRDGKGGDALALVALLCAVCASVLESMAIGVALPAIACDFEVSAATATWVMASAQLVIVALLLPVAALGEALGYRRVFLSSLVLFVTASIACMLAPSFPALVAARGVQAVGTAGVMSLGFAIARMVFSEARLGTAIGLMAATVAVGSSLGPALSGFILSVASWRAVFLLMVAMGAVAFILGAIKLPAVPPSGRRYDLVGAVLVAAMLTAALTAINAVANGWSILWIGLGMAFFLPLLWALIAWSRRTEAPVFPLDLLALPVFSLSVSASVCAFIAQTLGFILLPFYLVFGAGVSELHMALLLSVWPAATAVLAPIIGRLANHIPAAPAGASGLTILAIGFVLISRIDPSSSLPDIAMRFAVCGVGFAIFQTPNNRLIMLSTPRARSGAASGSLSVARQLGRAIGTAIAAFALIADPGASLGAMLAAAAFALFGAGLSLGRMATDRTSAP